MKRSVVIVIHVLAVLLAAAGLSVLYIGSPNGYGISWIREESYEDTPQFAIKVNEDLGNVKRLATLRDAFESGGEVDYNRSVAGGNTENGATSYTLQELCNIAQKFGCTIDPDTHEVTINPSDGTDLNNYELKISFKTYDPYYYDNLPAGPGQGITTLKALSYEVVQALGEYYRLKETYLDAPGNFYFLLHYLNAQDEYDDLQSGEKTAEEIAKLPRYVVVTGSGQNIKTNISPVPENAFAEKTGNILYGEDEYLFVAGVDTAYPYADSYRKAARRFEGDVAVAYAGIAMLVLGLIGAAVSAVPLLRFEGEEGQEILQRRHSSDQLPYELFLLLCAAGVAVLYGVLSASVYKVIHILAPERLWPYLTILVRMLALYAVVFYAVICSFRRYRKGGLYQNSLLRRGVTMLKDCIEGGSQLRALVFCYGGFTLGNVLMVTIILWLYIHREDQKTYLPIFALLVALLAAADCFIFVQLYRKVRQQAALDAALKIISEGETAYEVPESDFTGRELQTAQSLNHISVGLRSALNEQVKSERLKADLITNVSHDIKTPLTSIINYVDLIKREDVQNPRIREYIEVLDKKSARLKNLTEDLLEASKASSGNVKLDMQKIDLVELAMQAGAEFDDKFRARDLELCLTAPQEPVYIIADGRHLWRVLENLYNNAAKYAMEHTRVYADVVQDGENNCFTIKNVSAAKLNISPEELTERFVRGDVSRTTEGSGLGLSIAKSLTKLMDGELRLEIDGDLYKASVIFARCEKKEASDD